MLAGVSDIVSEKNIKISISAVAVKEMLLPFIIGLSALVVFVGIPLFLPPVSISTERLVELTNAERTKKGFEPLSLNEKLTIAAESKADEMAKERYFAHTTPSGKKFYAWVEEAGYKYAIVGENLATEFSESEPIVKAWMESPKHRENILNTTYNEIGIAIKPTHDERNAIVVQLFGREK